MRYYGDFLVLKTVRCRFNTANSSGVPTSLTGGAVIVSKDGADVTPTTPPVLTVDHGGVVGRNVVVIDMSVDATTYSSGSEYAVRLSGSSAVGGTSWVGVVVGEWSVQNRSVAVDASGTANTNVVKFAGVTTYAYDGVLAGATSNTITFSTTDAAGTAIPDDGRYEHCKIFIAGNTGAGQNVITTTKTSVARQYNVLPTTMPVQCDATSQYVVAGSSVADLDITKIVPLTNTPHTIADALNAARAQGFGAWVWPVGSTTLTLYAQDGTTPVHTFTLDSSTQPRSRS